MKFVESNLVRLTATAVGILEMMLTHEVSISNFTSTANRGDVYMVRDSVSTVGTGAVFRMLEKEGAIIRRSGEWHQYYDLRDKTRIQKLVDTLNDIGYYGLAKSEFALLSYGSAFLEQVSPENIPVSAMREDVKALRANVQWRKFLDNPHCAELWVQRGREWNSKIALTEQFAEMVSQWEYISELFVYACGKTLD